MSLLTLLAFLLSLLLDGDGDGDGDGGDPPKDPPKDDELGEAGKKALDAERAAAKASKKDARAATKRADDAEKALKALQSEGATEAEKAIASATTAAKEQAEKDVSARYKSQILATEVLAAATGKLANPSDAVRLLDLDEFTVPDPDADDEDLAALRKSIGEAVAKLIVDSPYLRSSKVEGDGDGGTKPPVTDKDEKLTPTQRLSKGYATNAAK